MIPIHPWNYNFGWQITLRHDDPLTQHSWNSKIFQKSDLYMTVKIMSLYYRDTCHPLYFNEKFEFSNFGVNWINHSVFEYWLILVRISRSKNLTPKGVHHFYFSCQKWHIYLEQNSRIWNTGSYKECSKRKYLNVHKTLLKLFSIRIWRVYKEFQIIISSYLATGRELDLVVWDSGTGQPAPRTFESGSLELWEHTYGP